MPLALRLGELSFAFYAFHYVPYEYTSSIGEVFPHSIGLAFVAALGLAIPAHHLVEVPVYQWVSRRLRKCDCHDDHVGLQRHSSRDWSRARRSAWRRTARN